MISSVEGLAPDEIVQRLVEESEELGLYDYPDFDPFTEQMNQDLNEG